MTRIFKIILIALALSAAAVGFSGCSHLRYVTRDFCELAPELQAHRQDTPGTKRELNGYRTLYDKRCPGDFNKWH